MYLLLEETGMTLIIAEFPSILLFGLSDAVVEETGPVELGVFR